SYTGPSVGRCFLVYFPAAMVAPDQPEGCAHGTGRRNPYLHLRYASRKPRLCTVSKSKQLWPHPWSARCRAFMLGPTPTGRTDMNSMGKYPSAARRVVPSRTELQGEL